MIETEGLTRKFGPITAVEGLTFQVGRGEIFGLLGPNGAGKTTVVRMLSCLISKTSGEARVGGLEVGNARDALAIRKMVGLVPDNVGLYEALSAYRNLDFYGKLYDCPGPERAARIQMLLQGLGMWAERDRAVQTFSKGMKQKIAIARALVHDPQVLLLDEPTTNLDPEAARTVRDFILERKKDGKTVLLNTHNLDEAQRICDRIGVLKGHLLGVGTPQEMEGRAGRRQTVIELEQVTPEIRKAIRPLVASFREEARRLVVDVADPERENPALVEAVVRAGGRVLSVTAGGPSLEDTYLDLVRGSP